MQLRMGRHTNEWTNIRTPANAQQAMLLRGDLTVADARTERWAEHRVQKRRRLVSAAMRAIERDGPQVSMREIAIEAGVPKPTLYRFFKDKSDLAEAIADQAREDILEQLGQARQPAVQTVGELVHLALTGYASVVDNRPNVFKVLLYGEDNVAVHAMENSRVVVGEVENLLQAVNHFGGGRPVSLHIYSSMIVGTVTGAAMSWMELPDRGGLSVDDFIAEIEPAVRAIVLLAGAKTGAAIDFDKPIEDLFPSMASTGIS